MEWQCLPIRIRSFTGFLPLWCGAATPAQAEAADLARRTIDLLERDLRAHGALHEYYHPNTGAPLMNRGFLSWNYLACEMLLV